MCDPLTCTWGHVFILFGVHCERLHLSKHHFININIHTGLGIKLEQRRWWEDQQVWSQNRCQLLLCAFITQLLLCTCVNQPVSVPHRPVEQTGRLGCPVGRTTIFLCLVLVSKTILTAAFTVSLAFTPGLASFPAKSFAW